jgi:ribosomal-protein-alanine N-acetyltransferase
VSTETFTLAPLRHTDVPRCVRLEHELFPGDDPWSARAFHTEIDAGNLYVGAYAPDGELIGYAGLSVAGRAPDLEASVHTIAVDARWQGRGVGKSLLRTLLAEADRVGAPVFLEVRTDNATAIGLYEAHGFRKLGLRRRYYQPSGADAHTMGRPAQVKEERL